MLGFGQGPLAAIEHALDLPQLPTRQNVKLGGGLHGEFLWQRCVEGLIQLRDRMLSDVLEFHR